MFFSQKAMNALGTIWKEL